ncbi:MAG: low molecular weight phosphotyrosine protein phosphatase [Patulibacter minatonensis]
MRVLFVCLGNICRSPTAEALFRAKVAQRGLLGEIEVDSAGTGGWHAGNPADRRAVAEAERRGISMSGRARQVTASDLRSFDLIVAMDESNRRDLQALATDDEVRGKIVLLREWDPEAAGHDRAVPDPYYGGDREFAEMFEIVDRATDGLLDDLAQRL